MSPDGSTNPPPEEKLLRLIRGKEAKPAAAAMVAPAGRPMPAALFKLSETAVRASPRRWPRIAAIAFSALLSLEATYLVLQLMRPAPVVQIPPAPSIRTTGLSTTDPATPTDLPSTEMPSLSASATRPLFVAPTPAAGLATGPSTVPSVAAKTLAARLSLMGIVAGNPAQAIIEDAQTKKTYFVTVGQTVLEGAVLQQVLDNRVILELQGEKIELTL